MCQCSELKLNVKSSKSVSIRTCSCSISKISFIVWPARLLPQLKESMAGYREIWLVVHVSVSVKKLDVNLREGDIPLIPGATLPHTNLYRLAAPLNSIFSGTKASAKKIALDIP